MSRKKLFYYLPLFLIVVLALVQIYFSNKLATQGRILKECEKEISLIEEENKKLKSEAVGAVGLIKLSQIASEKGFHKNPSVINLSNRVPVAFGSR